MRPLFLLVLFLAGCMTLAALPDLSPGQAPGSGYRWHEYSGVPGEAYLLYDGNIVGSRELKTGLYRAFKGGAWGTPTKDAPFPWNGAEPAKKPAPEEKPARPAAPQLPTGVDESMLRQGDSPIYWVGGKKVTKAEAYSLVGKGSIPDDKHKLCLTVIGTDEERSAAVKQMAPELIERVKLWSVPPDHWSVKDVGFKTDGHPTVYLQAPNGKVLWREDGKTQDGYKAIRKKAEDYDHKRDPGPGNGGFNIDLEKLAKDAYAAMEKVPAVLWVAIAAVILFLLLKKKTRTP